MEALDQFITNLATVILNPLIRLMFAVAIIYFLWGVFVFIKNADSETERTKGAQHILWSIVGLSIMIGVYTILRIAKVSILG